MTDQADTARPERSAITKIPSVQFAPEQYQLQLDAKVSRIKQLLMPFNPPTAEIFCSPERHYRMRAEFRIWHETTGDKRRCFYAMFDKERPRIPIEVTDFPIASRAICDLMQPLIEHINQCRTLSNKLFQIEFLSSSTREVLITLIYHRALDDEWTSQAKQLEALFGISVLGRSRKQKVVVSQEVVNEQLTIDGHIYHYQQKENSFTQPNAVINAQMIAWTLQYFKEQTSYHSSDLLEMYCGNGNFTIPLAQHFRRVIATEISKASIASALLNCQQNHVENIAFLRLSGEETASALRREREFRRLRHIDLNDYDFSTVLVDPPRAGLDNKTLDFIKSFNNIVYISCNPHSLATNMQQLSKTHDIEKFAIFDQFPYTEHCECGVILRKTA